MGKELSEMGKKYLIKVNGKMYEVEVEEMENVEVSPSTVQNHVQTSTTVPTQNPISPSSTSSQVSSAPSTPAPQTSPTSKQETSGTLSEGEKITAPMSGVVLKVNVKAGDIVKDAQTLVVIEAMKMENEILAPRDGKIKEVLIKEGQQVEIDQPLIVME